MAFLKSTIWSLSVAFIPVVCGNPCEFQRGGSGSGFVGFETGFAPETGIEPEVFPPTIESISATCMPGEGSWSFVVEASGQVGVARMYTRYAQDGLPMLAEDHVMNWDFHPTNGDWSLFTLSLVPPEGDGDWESGVSTMIPCEDPSYDNHAWIVEVWDTEGAFFVCYLYGAQASVYAADFPSCQIWE